MTTKESIELLRAAAQQNLRNPLRSGQLLHFPGSGELVVSGDLHNHRRNFNKLVKFSSLDQFPERHVILQEVIHGGPLGPAGEDASLEMVLDAAQWSLEYPGQVHFLLGNHDLAQIFSMPIMKEGYDLTERFNRAFAAWFGAHGPQVALAFRDFVISQPLGGITINGIMLCHSLPALRDMKGFDPTILQRPIVEADLLRNGSVFKLVWGRDQNDEVIDALSRTWWTDIFVCGHQAQDNGYGMIGRKMLIIDSSHNHGVLLPLLLDRQYTIDDLVKTLIPIAGIA
jgi:Calcineurin-like phosphoesterase